MAKIFYSMSGEGRGHAARVRTIVDYLRDRHELVLYAPDQAHDFLAPVYADAGPSVRVRPLPGLRFHYTRGRLDLTKSVAEGLRFLYQLGGRTRDLASVLRAERPDLVITDFEPILPRAAERAGVPYVSLSHQHFLVACDLAGLPTRLRFHAWLMSFVVRAHYHRQAATIVSSFFSAPLRRGWEKAALVGPLLREEVRDAIPADGDYVVSYLRANTPQSVLDILANCGRPVKVYGLGARPAAGPLRFYEFDSRGFVADLAGCAAMVGAAGNQSLGEAIHLGKPVLALPERRHHEQRINAHFLKQMGCGDWTTLEQFSSDVVRGFLERLPEFGRRLAAYKGRHDGAPAALKALEPFLGDHASQPTLAKAG